MKVTRNSYRAAQGSAVVQSTMDNYQLEHIIGVQAIQGGIGIVNDEEIAFSAPTHVVVQNIENHSQRFISTGEITALTVSPSRELIGVSEKGTGIVKLYETSSLRCRRKLPHDFTTDIIHISISKDSAICLVLGGQPEYTLTMWRLEKTNAKAFASIDLSSIIIRKRIVSADVCPTNSGVLSLIGEKVLRLLHVTNKTSSRKFIPVPLDLKSDPQNYTCQCWLQSGDLVVGADNGEIIVIGEERNVKAIFRLHTLIHSIVECFRGFAVGCCDGMVQLYQRPSKNAENYVRSKTVRLCSNAGITCMAVMRSAGLFCLTSTRSIIRVQLKSSDDDNSGVIITAPSLNQSTSDLDALIPDAGALCVDVCVWKTLVAIGGYDGIVRLFNFRSNALELAYQFDEMICDLSFHPSGDYVLLSTPTKVLLCAVLPDKLEVSWKVEDLNSCLVRFSDGGDKFAISVGSMVQIHSVYTRENISTLRGHSKAVIDIQFAQYKDEVTTIGADAVVCQWDINKGLTKTRFVDAESPGYSSGCVSNGFAIVASADFLIKTINLQVGAIQTESAYKPIVKSMTALPSGQILCSLDNELIDCIELEGDLIKIQPFRHRGKVTSIRHSKDSSKRIFIADQQGFLSVFASNEDSMEAAGYHPLDGILMVTHQEFATKESNIAGLEAEMKSLQEQHTITLESMATEHAKRKSRLECDLQLELDQIQSRVNTALEDLREVQDIHTLELERIALAHDELILTVEEDCKEKVEKEKLATKEFEARCDDMRKEFANIMVELEKGHKEFIDLETVQLVEKMTKENEKCDALMQDISDLRRRTQLREEAMEKDAEIERSNVALAQQARMKILLREKLLLEQEKSILTKRFDGMKNDMREVQEQVSLQEEKKEAAEETIRRLDDAIESSLDDISELDNTIIRTQGEMTFYSQSNLEEEQKNADLVRVRVDLEESMRPYDEEVKQLEQRLRQLCTQLKEEKETGKIRQVNMETLQLKLNQSKADLRDVHRRFDEKEKLLTELENRLFADVDSAFASIDDYQSLKACCRLIFEEFLDGKSKRKNNAISDREKLDSVKSKIIAMKKLLEQKTNTHAKEMKRLHREHAVLKKELEEMSDTQDSHMKAATAKVISSTNNSKLISAQNKAMANIDLDVLSNGKENTCHGN